MLTKYMDLNCILFEKNYENIPVFIYINVHQHGSGRLWLFKMIITNHSKRFKQLKQKSFLKVVIKKIKENLIF